MIALELVEVKVLIVLLVVVAVVVVKLLVVVVVVELVKEGIEIKEEVVVWVVVVEVLFACNILIFKTSLTEVDSNKTGFSTFKIP